MKWRKIGGLSERIKIARLWKEPQKTIVPNKEYLWESMIVNGMRQVIARSEWGDTTKCFIVHRCGHD